MLTFVRLLLFWSLYYILTLYCIAIKKYFKKYLDTEKWILFNWPKYLHQVFEKKEAKITKIQVTSEKHEREMNQHIHHANLSLNNDVIDNISIQVKFKY